MRMNGHEGNQSVAHEVDAAKTVGLKNIGLFMNLREDELHALIEKAVVKSFPKNAMVFAEGDSTRSLYVILSGKVKMFLNDKSGKEVVLDIRRAGDYFGEMALDEGPRPASIATIEPSILAMISGADFKALLARHPSIALHVIADLSRKARELIDTVRSHATLDVYGRISRMLLALAVERKGNLVIPERLTQQDMAGRVGTSREMVNRILRDLATGGYIDIKDKTITINRPLPARW